MGLGTIFYRCDLWTDTIVGYRDQICRSSRSGTIVAEEELEEQYRDLALITGINVRCFKVNPLLMSICIGVVMLKREQRSTLEKLCLALVQATNENQPTSSSNTFHFSSLPSYFLFGQKQTLHHNVHSPNQLGTYPLDLLLHALLISHGIHTMHQ